MAERRVKLQDTGEIVPKSKSGIYQAPNKKYYSSEDAYLALDLENSNRDKCIDMMYDFMGYSEKQKLSTFFYKKLSEWHEGYSYAVIDMAMGLSADAINYSNRCKSFCNETAKLNYFMAIIQNNLNDALKIGETLRKKVMKASKAGNLDAMIDGLESLNNISTTKKGADVSSLVGDL